jgi:hypothetical protein
MCGSDAEECGRMLRPACTNVIGFWQLLRYAHPKVTPVRRMQYCAHITSSALEMSDLILQHKHAIRGNLLHGQRIEEFTATANRLKFLAVALDGDNQDQFLDEAYYFAVQFVKGLDE